MTQGYQEDLSRLTDDLASARRDLVGVIGSLDPSQLAEARRGGWTVARVLLHLIESERGYARLAARLAGRESPLFPGEGSDSGSPAAYSDALAQSRHALLTAFEGLDEDSFYRLQRLGHEEYSVASLLENVAAHDREHSHQISSITSG